MKSFPFPPLLHRAATPAIALLFLGFVSGAPSQSDTAPDVSGIKAKNLAGADLKLMHDHDPASELENFALLDGFQANLFAAEPMIANPVHMTWDARSRLWVACSWAYPQLKPGDKADDKIIILEDTDGDGRADKSTVFADGLYMPIGIMLANGGAYVAQTPDVLFLKDTDGDDVADVRQVALTGFGIEDSHHSISAWRRGPGGWIYFQEGIFLHTQVETQYGVVRNYNGGVYQFNPRTQELRVFANLGVGNPWGHVVDRWGQHFMVDNARVIYLTPSSGASGAKQRAHVLLSTDKQCGGDLASGSHLPPEMRGQFMTGRFKSRKVVRYGFTENGSGFSANVLPPLIESAHPNFRPVDTKVGPDGAVYVADWYNSIINHAQHDFRDPRRDHEHGRIWRITHKSRPLTKRPDLVGATLGDLLGHLKSPDHWTRHYARLVLSERPDRDEVAAALRAWVENLDRGHPDHDHHLIEALWAFQNVERIDEPTLLRVLDAKSGNARSAGARTLRYWHRDLGDPVSLIAKACTDPFPRTRLEGILSAGFLSDPKALPAALRALDHPRDKFIDNALDQTVHALKADWVPALQAGEIKFASPDHRAFAMQKARLDAGRTLAAILKKKRATPAELRAATSQLVAAPDAKQIRSVADALAKNRNPFSTELSVGLLNALAEVGRQKKFNLGSSIAPLARFLESSDDAEVIAALGALGGWRQSSAMEQITGLLRDTGKTSAVRQAAAIALGEIGRPESLAPLRELAKSGQPVTDRYIAVLGLTAADLSEAAVAAGDLFANDPGESDPIEIITAFVKRDKGATILAESLAGKEIHPKVASTVAKHVRRSGPLPGKLGSIFNPATPASLSAALIAENPKKLLADVEKLGDPERGEFIYRRAELACVACHAIGGIGQKIGPDLAAVGAAATTEYIIESILHPNKAIAEHYENYAITTDDGKFHMGVIAFQSEEKVALRDLTRPGGELVIPRHRIKKMKGMPSLMPPSLADQLGGRQEFLDLAHFVSRLGRPGPFASSDAPVIRKWRLLPAETSAQGPGSIAADAPWIPAYSLVRGEFPPANLDIAPRVFARGFINVQVPGPVKLKLNSTKGLRLWLNETEIRDLGAPVNLPKGECILTFLINRPERPDTGLRVELETPTGSGAKFQVVGGL